MSYIDSINVGGTPYKIQETIYIAPSLNGTAYTASLTNFTLDTGVTVQAKFATTNPANATLNVNSTGAKDIYYNNAKITASQLKANHTYTLVYDGTQWQLVGDIDTNTQSNYGNITTSGTLGTASVAVVTDANQKITTEDLSVSDPSSGGNSTAFTFIDTISANAKGKISPTKKAIPTVSSSTAGLAPKGAAVSTQSQSTKFLREDGSWAAPSYTTNTDNDTKVTQTGVTDNQELSILLKGTNNTTDKTEGVKYGKTSNKLVTVNPSTGGISAAVLSTSGEITTKGNIILLNTSNGATPSLIFQRAVANDSYTDWKIQNNDSGDLVFSQRLNNTWTDEVTLTYQGKLTAVSFAGSGSDLTSLNASNISNGTLSADRLATSGATAGSYGPSAAVSGTNGTTMNVPYITVDNKGRVTSISNKVYTAVNTWRGIQDNLTSSTNTTESLSAKQGYLLANGSARDDTKVPISWMPYRSGRNFVNGTLITTNLSGGTTNCSIPFLLKIIGNGYGNGIFYLYAQGYVYNLGNGYESYINCNAVSLGKTPPSKITAFKDTNGNLAFWFPRLAYWQGFDVQCWDTSENISKTQPINHVTSITDTALPETRYYTTEITVAQVDANKANAANITSTKWGIAYYSDAVGTFAGTGAGTSGQYLKSNGSSAPTWATFSNATVGLGNVENTALSTWAGTSNITTIGTITSGTWNGTTIAVANGGTGATDAAGARTNLGLDSAATKNISAFVWNGGNNNNLGSGSPASNAKTYYEATDGTGMTDYQPYMVYNSSGVEWTLLFTGRKAYGSILKWGYNDSYLRILRRYNNTWKSTDWEKINAGYADSAGSASTATSWANARKVYTNLGSASTTTTINGGASDAAAIGIGVDGTLGIGNGGTGATTTLGAGLSYVWTAKVQGQTWSRLCYVPCSTSTVGSSILLNIRATRGSVVYNYTLLINPHHSSKCHINVLQGSDYSSIKFRGVVNSSGDVYLELNDSANSIAATTQQSVACTMWVITKGSTEPTLYETFTTGATLPSNFTAREVTLAAKGGFQTSGQFTGSGAGLTSIPAGQLTGTVAIANGGTGKSNDAAINTVFAGPSSGDAGAPSWRKLVAADIPDLSWNKITSDKPDYVTRWPTWDEVTSKPTSFTPSAHTHYELATIGDKRSESTTPNTYANRLIFQGLKTNTKINSPYTDTYSYLVGLRGWSDSTGGNSHELAFNGNGIYRRQGETTTWGNWFHLLDSGNTYAENSNGAVVSIARNTETTIATINGVAIKIKIPASDNTWRPVGTGATDAMAGNTNINNVTQSGNAEDKEYPILLKNTNNTTNETSGVKYSNNVSDNVTVTKPFTYNPSTGILKVSKIQIGIKDDTYGFLPYANNWNSLGASNLYWYKIYATHQYGTSSHVTNWDAGKNIGTAATNSAAATKGSVNFYNPCAAGGTQTKTLLEANSSAAANITITLPSTSGTLALDSKVDGLIAAADAMVFKGTLSGAATSSNSGAGNLTPTADCGWTYKVDTAGYINGLPVEVGDILICTTDSTPAATTSGDNKFDTSNIRNKWVIIQNNVDGAVFKSTNTFTSEKLLAADGTDGKIKTVSSIAGPFAITTSASADNAFSIQRTGTSEAVKHWVDDSAYHIDYINDETSSSVKLRIQNTNTESGGGANPTDYTYTFNYKGDITGATFSGKAATAGTADSANAVTWENVSGKPLTFTKNTTGFSIAGGTTSKTLTVSESYTLGAACAKGITDNSSNTDVTSSDTNLITGRTLYYQLAKKGYTTNTGTVTKVSTGAGLTGGDITTTGTIKAYLKSETKATYDSVTVTNTQNRQYAVTPDKTGYLSVNIPWTDTNTLMTQTLKTDNVDRKVLATTSNNPSSGSALDATYANYVMMNAASNSLSAVQLRVNYNGADKAYLQWNNTDNSIDFIFAS